MSSESRLRYASIAFGMIWAVAMIWWMGPGAGQPLTAGLVLTFGIGGLLVGLLWYWLMARFTRWMATAKPDRER